MNKTIYTAVFALFIILSGCKTNQTLRCPDVASVKSHHPLWVGAGHLKTHRQDAVQKVNKGTSGDKGTAVASLSGEPNPIELKIPRFAIAKLNSDELEGINITFQQYSANNVKLERKENGKLYLRANSGKDVIKLIKNISNLRKTDPAAASGGDGGRIALAGGIIGIIAIVLALGPYVSYAAFILGIIAIILGAVGLRSSRRGWAIAGIVLGVLAVLFAGVLGIGIYTIVLHI